MTMTANNQLALYAIQQKLNNIQSKDIINYNNAFIQLNNMINQINGENKEVDTRTKPLIMRFPMEIVGMIKSFVYSKVDVLFEWTRIIYKEEIIYSINNLLLQTFVMDFTITDTINDDTGISDWYINEVTYEELKHRKISQFVIKYLNIEECVHCIYKRSHICCHCGDYTGIYKWNSELRGDEFYHFQNITPDNPFSRNVFCKCVN